MSSLPSTLRRQLESAIKQARKIAERGGRKALEAIAVHEAEPYGYMNEAQLDLRSRLCAQAKQLGDGDSQARAGAHKITHLVEKLAYDQWHRVLFARFLLENGLLISPEHGVSVSLDDCEELAPSLGLKDAWAVAARFAAKELPEIFRADDPTGAVELPFEDRKPLIQLVTELPVDVFTANDSLGWCYQFWQAERKDEINAAGNKICADELPAVTQLFTEDYMVEFLLDNTLGAWHAGGTLAANPSLAENAESEEEIRNAVALPGCTWKHLRFVKNKDDRWWPAAGAFEGWPKTSRELKCLDPCMGSGHFVVAMFNRLVAMRMAEESLDNAAAVAAVITDNLFGLEIDPRCTQIGAFNLALAAWRRAGHCTLPAMNLACSGLAPNAKDEAWLKLAGDNYRLRLGLARLYALFTDAPELGSLINPRAAEGDLLEAAFNELEPLLQSAMAQETSDYSAHELAVTAQGVAKAAQVLVGQFTLVATNVPYLGRAKQSKILQDYCERVHSDASGDLAASFVDRCLAFCEPGGTTGLVTIQSLLFQGIYEDFRSRLLRSASWDCLGKLGPRAFGSIGGEIVNVCLVTMTREPPGEKHEFFGLDVTAERTPTDKAEALIIKSGISVEQMKQLENPDARVSLDSASELRLLHDYADAFKGFSTGDLSRYTHAFWEHADIAGGWVPYQYGEDTVLDYGGRHQILFWEDGRGQMTASPGCYVKGAKAWARRGVSVSQISLTATLYTGEIFHENAAAIVPKDPSDLPALWAFLQSSDYRESVRAIDESLKVTNLTLTKVPFDLARWRKVAGDRYPHGLPKPFSSDPTQWLFNGHPRASDQPLHVAVARLLGYQWPRQSGFAFPDCPSVGPDGLAELADSDGVVCLFATKGEAPAADRLRELLACAWGQDWNATVLDELLAQADCAGKTLDDWLRTVFFAQHCALFHNRPFIWHIWDGHKNGFSALVNYHRLTHSNLENLTYAYLGDWIRRQQAAVDAGEAGSDAKLQAARNLQGRLKLILDGEPPFDLFVRWKPLSQQAVGWQPDANDGVRLNIRPFLAQDISGGKKGAGILRARPNIRWNKDGGKEQAQDKIAFPWFWSWDEASQDFVGAGTTPDGNRWNDCHYSNALKQAAKAAHR